MDFLSSEEQSKTGETISPSPEPLEKKSNWLKFSFGKKNKRSVNDDNSEQGLDFEKNQKKEKKEFFEKGFKPEIKRGDLDISLMPEKTVLIPRIIYSRNLILIASLVVILTLFILGWLYADWYFKKIQYKVEETDREIQLVEAKSSSLLALRDEIIKMEENAARTQKILNEHIYWTKFFSLLEKYTINDVFFNDFSADTSGLIHLDSSGKSLLSIAQQIVVFSQAQDFVKEVRVSDVGKTPLGVKATFTLVLADNVFKK